MQKKKKKKNCILVSKNYKKLEIYIYWTFALVPSNVWIFPKWIKKLNLLFTTWSKQNKRKKWMEWKCVYIYSIPPPQVGCDTRSIFKWRSADLNTEFSFSLTGCLIKAKEPSLYYYLLIAEARRDGFMPFLRALVWSQTQTALSRIWTWYVKFISWDDKHHTTSASMNLLLSLLKKKVSLERNKLTSFWYQFHYSVKL